MGYRKWEIVACVLKFIILISLIIIAISQNHEILIYRIFFLVSVIISFIILFFFMKILSSSSWKFVTAAVYLSAVLICIFLIIKTTNWAYMFRFTSGVDTVAIVVLLLIIFLGETEFVIAAAILLYDILFLLFQVTGAFHWHYTINFTTIMIDDIVSNLISVVLLSLYLRSSLQLRWKVLTTIFFLSAYAFFILASCSIGGQCTRWNLWDNLFILSTFIYVLIVGTTLVYMCFIFFGTSEKLIYVTSLIYQVIFIVIFFMHVPITDHPYRLPDFIYIVIPCISTLIFYYNLWMHVSCTLNHKWKLVVMVFALCAIAGFIFTYIFSNIWKLVIAKVYIGIDILLSTLLCLWIYGAELWVWWKRTIDRELEQPLQIAGLPAKYTYRDISEATENFQSPIGEGGSGTVFKGKLSDGTPVAVKKTIGQSSRGSQLFLTELTVIASLQHVNLVRLLGYCLTSTGDRYLIYPFYGNGDLNSWLFGDEAKKNQLTWRLRFQIAIDVARALKYLHHDCHHQILHLDVKPGNILLDGDFRALVTDFGISKLIGRGRTHASTTAGGTLAYMAPEVWARDAISVKTDVYSFGMVLMELAAGRKNNECGDHGYFLKIARDKMLEGGLLQIADNSLSNGETSEEELALLVKVGFWCIQNRPSIRPNMVEIVDMLEGRRAVEMPPRSTIHLMRFLDEESQEGEVVPLRIDEIEMTCGSLTNSLTGR